MMKVDWVDLNNTKIGGGGGYYENFHTLINLSLKHMKKL